MTKVIDRNFRAQLEVEPTSNGVLKVTEKFISDLRALAKRQKAEENVENFVKILGNKGKDVPKLNPEEIEINLLTESFEIEEE